MIGTLFIVHHARFSQRRLLPVQPGHVGNLSCNAAGQELAADPGVEKVIAIFKGRAVGWYFPKEGGK